MICATGPDRPRPAQARTAEEQTIVTVSPQPQRPTPDGRHAAEPSIGELVSEATTQLSNLVHSEIELAKLELRSSVKNAGVGAGFFGAAGVLLAFSAIFGFVALAEGIHAAGLWRWLSYLVVFLFMLALIATFVLLGVKKVKRVRAPQKTIETSKDTVSYLKANTKRG
jgi:uncharacterized membrane protein YqjE